MPQAPTAQERMMRVHEVLMRAVNRELSWIQAADILGCTPRSLRRWRLRYQKFGMHGLVDGRTRGHRSPRWVRPEAVEPLLRLYRERYRGFNVRHFCALARREHGLVLRGASEGLRGAPLDRDLYFYRALAHAALTNVDEAVVDFRRAKLLEPGGAALAFEEGRAWLGIEPRLALAAWRETLERAAQRPERDRRATAPGRADWYRRMLAAAQDTSAMRPDLRALAMDDRELLLVFLESASTNEVQFEVDKLLLDDPALVSLNSGQRAAVLRHWARRGDAARLEAAFKEHPDWLETGWPSLAMALGRRGAFAEACALARERVRAPALPQITRSGTAAELFRMLQITPTDVATGYALYRAQIEAGDETGALLTLRKMTALRACPAYFHYLEADLLTRRGAWAEAWNAWDRFLLAAPGDRADSGGPTQRQPPRERLPAR